MVEGLEGVSAVKIPMTGAVAEYRGARYPMLFGNSEWFALGVDRDTEIPDAFARGERNVAPSGSEPWAKVPVTAIDAIIDVRVKATVRGETVSLQRELSDGRIQVGFVGSPAAAAKLGLEGDQHMGWIGVFEPAELRDIRVQEARRV